uniref:Protein kinase domain-containing protein n=1 Tax=Davidia involucrata TaxID=16924 RepID=A0A5B6YIL7_DAVIN
MKTTSERIAGANWNENQMKLIGNGTVGESEEGGSGGGGGTVVVVGVKLDSRSRELLTWALVKVAQSGDRVIALHVLNPSTEGKSTLLSLIKTFDSVLAAYEGFCNLKQVDLKLKVCRASSVRKVLLRKAKSCGASNLVVGTSSTHHTIRSSVSVAKYCSRHLSKNFSVFAVDNGKVVFQREATTIFHDSQDDDGSKHYIRLIHQSLSKYPKVLHNATTDAAVSKSNQLSSLDNGNERNLMALVPVKIRELPVSKPGWALLRRVFLHNRQQTEKSSVKNNSVVRRLLGLPSRQSLAAEYPDQKKSNSDKDEFCLSKLDEPLGTDTALPPYSPNCLNRLPKELEGLHEKYSSIYRLFSYQELLLATSNFMPDKIVGKGGSSQVYRGCLPDGKELAVKILKPSEDVLKQFVLEIEIITTLHHNNIISLFGFCFEDNNLLLVYDFLSRGSLEENLYGYRRNGITFGWEDRYKVALGVAEALDYLHNGVAEPIIHRDVKSSNILLSDDFRPQLSDFGLSIWASSSCYHMTCTDIAGTFGYLAPEYFMHGKMNDKIDVYAFGVVLLELLSGRRPIDNKYPKGQESLVMWAKPILKSGKVSRLLDPSLGSDYDNDQIERMVLAATLCIRRAPRCRPQISHVLKLLRGDAEVINWARQQVSDSEEFDAVDGEVFPTNIQSHLNLALQELEDESPSSSSIVQIVSVEDYL